jgi:hypothetical protein
MDEQSSGSNKLNWKWIGITLLLYLVFYPSPMLLAHYLLAPKAAEIFIGTWLFAGIIIIGAVTGYLSEGVTLWEPAIAAGGFIALFIIVGIITSAILGGGPKGLTFFQSVVQLIAIIVIFFVFSLFGAWIGERAQKLWRPKSSQRN